MNKNCSSCGLQYEREEGYNIGGVIIHYLIAGPIGLITIISLMFGMNVSFAYSLGFCVFQAAIMHPFVYRYSTLVWMHMHQAIIDSGYEGKR